MAKYQHVDVSEQLLEDLIRLNANQIEEGLVYVHHQQITGSHRYPYFNKGVLTSVQE